MNVVTLLAVFGILALVYCPEGVNCTNRYYGTYLSYGTGDTLIETAHAQGGTKGANRKWNVECLDGEAVIGVRDTIDDFQRINSLWCKFMFPYKFPTGGLYPYYPNCHVRTIKNQSFCFDPSRTALTINTFVTGLWNRDFQFRLDRKDDGDTCLYKCCRTPLGYYIDYLSCLYKPTHDQYWEYYDAPQFLVFCDTGYVMTGMARNINAWDQEGHLDWIQCCRIGFQPPSLLPVFFRPTSLYNAGAGWGSKFSNSPSLSYRSLAEKTLPEPIATLMYNEDSEALPQTMYGVNIKPRK